MRTPKRVSLPVHPVSIRIVLAPRAGRRYSAGTEDAKAWDTETDENECLHYGRQTKCRTTSPQTLPLVAGLGCTSATTDARNNAVVVCGAEAVSTGPGLHWCVHCRVENNRLVLKSSKNSAHLKLSQYTGRTRLAWRECRRNWSSGFVIK
ncbi:hypothetical protein BaRGS_00014802 [Batillaria attramentaria]|uniref:Uncharacterized protein n=1 Tax=Batillaria attramentaria TaxID=370345 RepID=A0ABD0L3L5_9CAEN